LRKLKNDPFKVPFYFNLLKDELLYVEIKELFLVEILYIG